MANEFCNYSPDQIIINLGGRDLQAIADGTFVKAVRNEKSFKTKVGAGGAVTRIRSRNFTGLVTLTLQAGAPDNDYLQALVDEDEELGTGVRPLLIKDLNGLSLVTAEKAWITKVPDWERSDDGPNTEWEIECARIFLHNGSSLT